MFRRWFAPRKRRAAASRPYARLHLEQLEKREVMDAALVQGLNVLAVNAFQTAQQIQQAQTVAQTDLTQFRTDAISYTANQGVTLNQINQDMATLKQDASTIQDLNATFQKSDQFFYMGVFSNLGNITSQDEGAILGDAFLLANGQTLVNSALLTANAAASVVAPPAPPSSPSTRDALVQDPLPTGDPTGTQLVTLTLNPLNVNLLGLNLRTSTITINIAADQGNSELLGNLLGDTANLVNLPAVSGVVNNVLANVVTLLNSGTLSVAGVNTTGSLGSPTGSTSTTTSVLTLHVAPVHLNLLGADVTTSPIDVTLTGQSGQGLVLGNIVTDLANLFNPPLPKKLSLNDINAKLNNLLNELNTQLPNVGGTPTTVTLGPGQFLNLTVAPINLNLLGLILQTSSIQVNATNQTGNGDLLGNLGTTLLNTIDATPTNLTTFNSDLDAILGKVIGVLNASTLTLPAGAIGSLSPVLQELTSPTLVTSTVPSSASILNLAIASPNGGTPVNVDLLGLDITTSNIQAQLTAQTGDGQVLGNLLFNVANLLNPGGSAALLPILGALGL